MSRERKPEDVRTAELLAPAGSGESLRAAVNAGADAVYIGGQKFGARAYAENPDEGSLLDAIAYAHLYGVRVHLTVNTLFKERELAELPDYLRPYYEAGLDAAIVQDFGALRVLHREFPDLPLHASTQTTVTGPAGALFMKELGVCRVIPARELSLQEIREIKDRTGLEVETFVHGSLCYSYSGQCLMSSLIGGRSGNRGRCAQPCRFQYELLERGVPVSRRTEPCLLSMKDLCSLGGRFAAESNALPAIDHRHGPLSHLRLHVIQISGQDITCDAVIGNLGKTTACVPAVSHGGVQRDLSQRCGACTGTGTKGNPLLTADHIDRAGRRRIHRRNNCCKHDKYQNKC